MSEPAQQSRRGGTRPGAGRKPKGYKTASGISVIDLKAALAAPAPDDIETFAQQHAHEVIAELVKIMLHGRVEAARVNAANAILDRGYGKPSNDAGGMQISLFGAGVSVVAVSAIRDLARSYASLAVAVLRKIATGGESESARVSAGKSLLDRGVGTVAQAKVIDDVTRPLGKKEEAAVAARNVADEHYAPWEQPRSIN